MRRIPPNAEEIVKQAFVAALMATAREVGKKAIPAIAKKFPGLAAKFTPKPKAALTTAQRVKSGVKNTAATAALTVPFMGGQTAAHTSKIMSPPTSFR